MGKTFVNKVEHIILSKIQDEKFGVSDLAGELGLSRSQVLRKVRAETGKSVNQLIREIKLREGARLLAKDELTASEIAYEVGFSSPSYFNKCFLDQFGVTPGEYKKKYEAGEIKETDIARPPVEWWRKKSFVSIVLLLAIVISGYFVVVEQDKNTKVSEASIAVIPFLDLSANSDQEYLADGITEALTTELSRIKQLRVPSRTSSMTFKGEKKLSSVIARELNVNLILEGSVFKDGDSILITVQLIEVHPEEKHVWADNYALRYANVLQLVNQISVEIASNISSVVQPEVTNNEIKPVDPKAYDLYLRGRHIWNTQNINKQPLLNAVAYLQEAIDIDPEFAQAYVTLAETYLAINALIGDNEEKMQNRIQAGLAIDKAMELNQSLAEAYITKGNLVGKFNWDWENMKVLAQKGLDLEPSNANAHLILSNYYVVKGNYKKAIEEALKAHDLDPINPQVGCLVAERYYIAGDYDRAIQKYQEVIDLNPNYGWAYNNLGFVYMKAGETEKGVETWQQLQVIRGHKELYDCYDEHPYQFCFNYFLENAKVNDPRFCSNPVLISLVDMLVDDPESALDYLGIAKRYKNEDLPVMIAYPDFYASHSHPEFQEIVRKVGVKL